MISICGVLLFDFDMVESFAIYAFDIALCDECFRVDVLDQSEEVVRFSFLCQNKHDVYVIAGIESFAVEYGHSAVHVVDNTLADLFVMF